MKSFKLICFLILSLIIPVISGSELKFTEKIIVFFVSFVGCWIANFIKLIFMPDFVIGTSSYVLGKQLYWSIGIYITGALVPGALLAQMYSEKRVSPRSYQSNLYNYDETNSEESENIETDTLSESSEDNIIENNVETSYETDRTDSTFNEKIDLDEIYNNQDTSQLSELNAFQLKVLRNYPFAKDGYVFKDKKLQKYFERMEWYTPSTYETNDEINERHKENEWLLAVDQFIQNNKK